MKLSEYKNEDAIAVLADLSEPVISILNDEEVQSVFKKDKKQMLEIAQVILRRKPKEIIQVLAITDGIPIEKANYTVYGLLTKTLEILNEPELVDFFKSQGQSLAEELSGSATENIEGIDGK